MEILKENNMEIIISKRSYKPAINYLFGLLLEPLSKIMKKVLWSTYGTWAYWGFETIIWAKKS
jgi:hypothetical protein